MNRFIDLDSMNVVEELIWSLKALKVIFYYAIWVEKSTDEKNVRVMGGSNPSIELYSFYEIS